MRARAKPEIFAPRPFIRDLCHETRCRHPRVSHGHVVIVGLVGVRYPVEDNVLVVLRGEKPGHPGMGVLLEPVPPLRIQCSTFASGPDSISERFLDAFGQHLVSCLLYTSPSPRDRTRSRMP